MRGRRRQCARDAQIPPAPKATLHGLVAYGLVDLDVPGEGATWSPNGDGSHSARIPAMETGPSRRWGATEASCAT
jgi:hypothetical protein